MANEVVLSSERDSTISFFHAQGQTAKEVQKNQESKQADHLNADYHPYPDGQIFDLRNFHDCCCCSFSNNQCFTACKSVSEFQHDDNECCEDGTKSLAMQTP